MEKIKIGFILDPPEKIKCLEDTSFYIMKEAFERGHDVYYIDSRHVSARGARLEAEARTVQVSVREGFGTLRRHDSLDLASLDVIFIRKDPPFDSHYLYLTCLLENLRGKVPMLNDPAGIRGANEKLYILRFPEWITDVLVSTSADELLAFVREAGDVVLKPLNERGGTGVFRFRRGEDPGKIEENLRLYGTLMGQRFIPEVQSGGDKRILLLNGEILGGYVRVPPKGDFRVSIYHDGRYEAASFTDRERKMVEDIRGRLLQDGLFFVGLDVIGGYISEINVTSPAGIPESNHFIGRKLEEEVVSFLEKFAGAKVDN